MTSKTSGLPHRITKLATDMFARETGFSGPEIHDIFAEYTDALGPYQGWGGGAMSRWQVFQAGLKSMPVQQQKRFLLELCSYDGGSRYGMPPEEQIEKLRSLLLADGTPGAKSAGEGLEKLEDWQAVAKSWTAALSKVTSDPDGAITATRTTLESICKHICDERSVAYENSWDLAKLYKVTASSMEVSPDQHSEQIIKQILSGATTVVSGLAGMRNALSDAHGRGKGSVGPAPRHAKLAVNAGFAIAGFLIDTHIEKPARNS
ncbi:abortive infection family protein [Gordonia terrae]|uniref:abortive infection family protein n=1 Tax=Gordonia terrae TaxID=2055 RepID=UPI002009E882|nr:abortive infection family protein [Gordonia terrae]UPW09353.1 abortive infection family protein [Gordonia terrae]